MTLDLVQLRWQQIRATESSQLMAKENIELKQQVVQLKVKLMQAQNQKSGIKMDFLIRIQMQAASFAMRAKSELSKLKLEYETEVKGLVQMKNTLARAFEGMKGIVFEKNLEIDVLRKDLKKLDYHLMQCKMELEEKDRQQEEKLAIIDMKVNKQKEEIKELRQKNASLEHELSQSKDYNAELNKQKVLLEKSIQVYNCA